MEARRFSQFRSDGLGRLGELLVIEIDRTIVLLVEVLDPSRGVTVGAHILHGGAPFLPVLQFKADHRPQGVADAGAGVVRAGRARRELKAHSKDWPSWDLTARLLCDLELLMSGGFSPLRGFMNRADYEGVCHNMRLGNGTLWPMPITLDVSEDFAKKLTPGSSKIALRDPEGVMLAVLSV